LGLLGADEPPPVEVLNPGAAAPVVLACEHAGRTIPRRLGDLGLPPAEMDRHIAWDIGAAAVARRMAAGLDACLVLQRYSRLVVDCNRPREASDAIPTVSDGTRVPANVGLKEAEREARWHEIHEPFHAALSAQLEARRHMETAALSLITVHSFTPHLDGVRRPWALGLLRRHDQGLAARLMEALHEQAPDETIAINRPYDIDDLTDYTIPVQAERRGLPNVLIEIRNDLIADEAGQAHYADMLVAAIRTTLGCHSDDRNGWISMT